MPIQLDPGDSHPNAPCPPAEIARRLGVGAEVVAQWTQEGMPALADGRYDPYAVVSWVSWQRLAACPALARKWRSWLRWFTTPGRPCRLAVRRAQEVYLPTALPLRWLVPEPPDAPGQRVLGRIWQIGEPAGACRLLDFPVAARTHAWMAEDDLELAPVAVEPRDRPWCEELLAGLAGAFTYAYRRHRPGGQPAWSGTCLDLALLTGAELTRRGRPWRLVSGVVAHRALANAHFWIEFDDGPAGWVPLDPTIPAVARMLGPDWRDVIPAAVGHYDARRIRVGHALAPAGGGIGDCCGSLDAAGADALYCTDWAVGECSWSVSAG